MSPPEIIVVCLTPISSLDAWQAAVDREGFDLALGRSDPGNARLGDVEVPFRMEAIDLARVPGLAERPSGRWRFAFAFSGSGGCASSVAARAAALGYLSAAGGALVDPLNGPIDVEAFIRWSLTLREDLRAALPQRDEGRAQGHVRAIRL